MRLRLDLCIYTPQSYAFAAFRDDTLAVPTNLTAHREPTHIASDMAFERPLYPTRAFDFLDRKNLARASELPVDYCRSSRSPRTSERLPTSISDPAWQQNQRQTKCPLDIIIVGAGLGGLAAAIALTLSGHKVRVFEQAPAFGEVGAGIQVPPNSTRLFLSWGVGPHIEQYISEPHTINLRRWKDGSLLGTTKLKPDFRHKYNAPYFVLHRADYHSALLARAKELGVIITGDSEVASYNFSTDAPALILLKNGTMHSADLVIGSDGVKSLARTSILESHGHWPILPAPTSQSAYRCTIPLRVLASNPSTAWVTETPNQNLWIGPGRHSMTYAIGGLQNPNRLFNLVLCHPEARPPDQWPTSIDTLREEIQGHYAGWDSQLNQILSQVLENPEAKLVKWPISTIAPLPTWTHKSGRMIALGDAAHAMVPFMSQGAAIAVEDAAATATVLSLIETKEDLPKALKILEEVRKVRAEGMQQASWLNGEVWHLEDGALQKARDEGMGDEEKSVERGWNANPWSDPTCQEWTYGYDAVREIENRWAEAGK